MPESTKKRRRWPWLLLSIGLILIGGWLAWQWRPLNVTERRLVGSWEFETGEFHFAANRRFTRKSANRGGSWRASGDSLTIIDDVSLWKVLDFDLQSWVFAFTFYVNTKFRGDPIKLRFVGPDRVRLNELEIVRMPDRPERL